MRIEVETALQRRIATIPVLVGGARMPARRDLPSSIWGLAEVEAAHLRDETFVQDARRLMDRLTKSMPTNREHLGPEKTRREAKFSALAKLFTTRLEDASSKIGAVPWRRVDGFRAQLDAIVDNLDPEEEVVDLALATFNNELFLGVLAITPRRFLFSPRIQSEGITSIPFETLVRVRRGPLSGYWSIVVTTPETSVTFNSVKPASRVDEILNYVRGRVG
ncbi:hypothetical protein [Blastococcus sp. PRF04-17]|uniref:hypothetical protein n=1 Tax=Blastococcus sp. PRF04-17 TaxID=2933797 RepID=UPI001FF65C1A|nr:hypothetical protein [Blastococcus sp. PRF04-17]UOY02541.1 hypothetical protein MVA48_03950 [Blastococcus sp. PRF04-17]